MQTPSKNLSILLIVLGSICVILGTIGILLPILPTTPFLLAAAACFTKGSKKLYDKLLSNRILGSYIRNYQEGKGIPLPTKIFTIALLWITISSSIVFFLNSLVLRLLLLLIALCVTIHLVAIKTAPKAEETITEDTLSKEPLNNKSQSEGPLEEDPLTEEPLGS